ncbi:hypothetical protein ACFRFH_12075 [Leifsonia sp. NPDC056824]|uniref:hypothetical protein n=1 Tax=Leifsonia sp. NPDC056824 TaxID=3345953 RepID=UPI00369CDDDF
MNTYTITYGDSGKQAVVAKYFQHDYAGGWIAFKDDDNKVVLEVNDRLVKSIARNAGDSTVRAAIAEQIRNHCTPSQEAYQKGGDSLIAAVADWVENPPDWVTTGAKVW